MKQKAFNQAVISNNDLIAQITHFLMDKLLVQVVRCMFYTVHVHMANKLDSYHLCTAQNITHKNSTDTNLTFSLMMASPVNFATFMKHD